MRCGWVGKDGPCPREAVMVVGTFGEYCEAHGSSLMKAGWDSTCGPFCICRQPIRMAMAWAEIVREWKLTDVPRCASCGLPKPAWTLKGRKVCMACIWRHSR